MRHTMKARKKIVKHLGAQAISMFLAAPPGQKPFSLARLAELPALALESNHFALLGSPAAEDSGQKN